jgi:iron complex outermembrane receptor protein
MTLRKFLWMGTASSLALACSIQSSRAAEAAPEEIVVTGYLQSLQQSLAVKRDSEGISEVVSAEDVGKMPDKNVADALQRLPGIDIMNSGTGGSGGFDENDRVGIRGSSPSLTDTTINGHRVASGDWFVLDQFQAVGRGVSFSLLPSEIVSSVVVHKSQSADLQEGGVAGTIDIQTRRPLDVKEPVQLSVTAGAAYNDLAGSAEPQLNGTFNWHNDAKTFGVNAIGFYEKRDLRRDGQEELGYNQVPTTSTLGKAGYAGYWAPGLMDASYFTQTREREGGLVDFEFAPSDKWTINVDGFYSKMNANNVNDDVFLWPGNGGTGVMGSGPLPTGIKTNGNVITAMTLPAGANNWGTDQIPRTAWSSSAYIDADFKFRPDSHWLITGDGGWSHGVGKTTSSFANEYVNQAAGGYSLNGLNSPGTFSFPGGQGFLTNPVAGSGWGYSWNWSDVFTEEDDDYYGQTDVEYFMDSGILTSVKAGVRYNEHSRIVNPWVDGGPNWGTYDPANETPTGSKGPGWGGGTTPSNYGQGLGAGSTFPFFTLNPANQTAWAATYTNNNSTSRYYWPGYTNVDEKIWAGYIMGNFGGTFANTDYKGNAGVRIVRTHENINYDLSPGPNPITTSAFGPYTPTVADYSYTDVLPSVNVSDQVAKNMYVKASIGKTLARPDYSSLGGAVTLNDQTFSGTAGNPYLKPIRAWNYNLDWEWYFAPESLLSVGVFYTDFSSAVDFATAPETYYNQFYKKMTSYNLTTFINDPGTEKGAEFNYQQNIYKGFGVTTNFTEALSKLANGDPMPGNARETYNIGAYYENDLMSLRLTYSWRSKFYITIDRGTPYNQDNFGTLDAAFNFNITPNFTFSVDALNMTDEHLQYYGYGTNMPRAFYDNGRTFYGTLRYKM